MPCTCRIRPGTRPRAITENLPPEPGILTGNVQGNPGLRLLPARMPWPQLNLLPAHPDIAERSKTVHKEMNNCRRHTLRSPARSKHGHGINLAHLQGNLMSPLLAYLLFRSQRRNRKRRRQRHPADSTELCILGKLMPVRALRRAWNTRLRPALGTELHPCRHRVPPRAARRLLQ